MASTHTYPPTNPPPYSAGPAPVHSGVVHQPQMAVYPGTTIVTSPTILVASTMGPSPTGFTCKSCNQSIVTRIERKPTLRTHMFALFLCFIGFWPCVCVPYCIDSCNNADHYCPYCNAYVGSYIG